MINTCAYESLDFINCKSITIPAELQELNEFVPHNIVGEGPNKPPPVQIGFATSDQKPPENQHDCLINLSGEIQPFFSYFLKCFEIVPNEEADKESARERYKFYRGRGYPLDHKKY